MLRLVYLLRNLARNPMRTLLTGAAVALPIMIYVLSMAVVDGIERFLDNSSKQLRLAVTHKASIVNPLPGGYRAKIEALDPTKSRILWVCGTRFIGGKVEGNPMPLSTLAVDPDTFLVTFPEHAPPDAEAAEWVRERRALVVGSGTAMQLGWKKGDRVTMIPSFPPYRPLEFKVIAISPCTTDSITNFFRLDYYNEELKAWGGPTDLVSFFFVKCATAADVDHYRKLIDDQFARTPDETKTQDEKSFMMEYIRQQFDLPRNLSILATVTVLVAILAAANTMSMNFRDRLTELAALKALGFGGPLIFGLIQSESLFLCMLGGFVGAAGPYVAFTYTPLREFQVPLILHLTIDPAVCVKAIGISAIIGVAAAVWPSWSAWRLHVVDALRRVN